MKKVIGIIAPFIDTRQYNLDFSLRLSRNNRELTLAAFYELASESFKAEHVTRGVDYGEDIPAAGFYLEGLLHQHGYDTILTNKYDTATIETMAEQDPFAVCISTTMIISAESLLELFSSVRIAMPGTLIIAGGALVWKNYLQFLMHLESPQHYPLQRSMLFHPDHANIDADILVVAAHGKSSLLEVLATLEKGRSASFEHIPNLCLPGDKGFNFTKRVEEQVDYNEDYTRWDLIDEIPEKIPLRTSIGCPYRCRFCDFWQLYPRIFLRSGKSLLDELNLIKSRLGQNLAVIHVSDDNVFITRKRLHEVCGAIADSGIRHWVGFMRGGEYSDDEMDAIKRSGLMMGKIGVESGDQGQLDRMNKRQKIENVKRGVEQLDAHGISTLLTFVVGFPGENQHTLQNTADFLNSLSLTNLSVGYQLYPLVIFPLSELADPSVQAQWKLQGTMEKWSHFTMNSEDASKACYDLFKEVTNVPYSYSEESFFFNRGMFNFATRKLLFQLRQQLTIKLIEKAPWEQIEPILKNMAQQMSIPADGIGEQLSHEISTTYKQ
jgi:anaerobic magnesium-protoporphyrin IX monomethyl ester cyclase